MNIRKARKEDIPAMGQMLARAFHHDPIVDWVFRDESRRPKYTRRFFEGRARVLIGQREIYLAEDCAAAATTASPGARQALGFEALLRGDVEAMKAQTRRYAKRQLTWMRKLSGAHVVDVTDRDPAGVAAELHALLRRSA